MNIAQSIEAVNSNGVLQAISILAAVVTAGYYGVRAIVWVSKWAWLKAQPGVSNAARRVESTFWKNLELAVADPIYLVSEIGRRLCIVLLFIALYFIIIFDEIKGTDTFPVATQWAKQIFSMAWTWNLLRLLQWLKVVRDQRTLLLEKRDRQDD